MVCAGFYPSVCGQPGRSGGCYPKRRSSFCLRAAQCHINPRQSKVLEAGHIGSGGGFFGGMISEKYAKITGTSKATATRDLADLLANGLLRVEGVGKATRYAVNVPGWEQPVLKP